MGRGSCHGPSIVRLLLTNNLRTYSRSHYFSTNRRHGVWNRDEQQLADKAHLTTSFQVSINTTSRVTKPWNQHEKIWPFTPEVSRTLTSWLLKYGEDIGPPSWDVSLKTFNTCGYKITPDLQNEVPHHVRQLRCLVPNTLHDKTLVSVTFEPILRAYSGLPPVVTSLRGSGRGLKSVLVGGRNDGT